MEQFSSAEGGPGEGDVSCSLALDSLLDSLPLPLLLPYIGCTCWRWVFISAAVALIPRMSSMEWLPVGDLLLSLSLMVITAHSSLMLPQGSNLGGLLKVEIVLVIRNCLVGWHCWVFRLHALDLFSRIAAFPWSL